MSKIPTFVNRLKITQKSPDWKKAGSEKIKKMNSLRIYAKSRRKSWFELAKKISDTQWLTHLLKGEEQIKQAIMNKLLRAEKSQPSLPGDGGILSRSTLYSEPTKFLKIFGPGTWLFNG